MIFHCHAEGRFELLLLNYKQNVLIGVQYHWDLDNPTTSASEVADERTPEGVIQFPEIFI